MASHSFTTLASIRLRELVSNVGIKNTLSDASPRLRRYKAIWDTGATRTIITKNVITECRLLPIGRTTVIGVNKTNKKSNIYPIELHLPNRVIIQELPVAEAPGELGSEISMLIGMDIIGLGDFAVSNYQGRTSFTFRIPSQGVLDFATSNKNVGRNAPCPCGSGLKYKNCHGHR